MSYEPDDLILLRAISPSGADDVPADPDDAATHAALARIARAARDSVHDDEPAAPPAGLWDAIAAELGDELAPSAATDAPRASATPEPNATVVPIDAARRRSRRGRFLAGAVAAAAAVALVVGVVSVIDDGEVADDEPTTVASATLDPLGDAGTGEARLVRAGDALALDLTLADVAAPDDEFLEVWLIDRDVKRLVSLGPVQADGVYELPAGLDPADFPVVDVSTEPLDGQPTHSGASIVRGTLTF